MQTGSRAQDSDDRVIIFAKSIFAFFPTSTTNRSISAGRPKPVDLFTEEPWDHVITVCDHAREACPLFTVTAHHRVDIGFEDPASVRGTEEEIRSAFRRVRDEMKDRLGKFYRESVRPAARRD